MDTFPVRVLLIEDNVTEAHLLQAVLDAQQPEPAADCVEERALPAWPELTAQSDQPFL